MNGTAPADTAASAQLEALRDAMPFARSLGIAVRSASAEEVVAVLPWTAEHCTAGGLLHGGALMALADSAGGICAYLGLPEGASTATTQSATNLLRGVRNGDVIATARPVHRGRTQSVIQVDLTDTAGRLVARTTQTQAVLPGPV